MTAAPITVRTALRLLLQADSYPHLGNEDEREAKRLEAEALRLAQTAEASPDDPPEFARWLAALLTPNLPAPQHEAVYWAMHDFFDPEEAID